MPVQMGRHVAETGEIDLVRGEQRSDNLFNRKNDIHERETVSGGEIGHLTNVIIPYDTAKTRIVWISNTDNAARRGFPEDFTPGIPTQFACWSFVVQCPYL